jgi:hypothetical protein
MAFEELHARFGDAYVDLEARQGVGIDGCRVAGVSVEGRAARLAVESKVGEGRRLDIVLARPFPSDLQLHVNDEVRSVVAGSLRSTA